MTVQSATLKHVDSFRRPSVGSEKDLVARAEALIPVLRSRVEETEAGRTLTSETRRDLMESGVHRIFQPKRFGGAEGSLRAGVDILAAIGQGCSATAWVLVQNMTHNWMVAQWPIEAQEAVWGEEPAALLSGILIPGLGKARRVDGGYRLSGRWPFLSGVNVCDWALFTAFTDGPNGEREDRHFLLPRNDFEILDTWRSVGLRGTCSNDAEVRDAFVPEHMTTTIKSLKGAVPPPDARLPDVLFPALRDVRRLHWRRRSGSGGSRRGGVCRSSQETGREIVLDGGCEFHDAAHQDFRGARMPARCASDALRRLRSRDGDFASGRLPNDEERTRFRSEAAFAGRMFTQAVNIVWDAGGAV